MNLKFKHESTDNLNHPCFLESEMSTKDSYFRGFSISESTLSASESPSPLHAFSTDCASSLSLSVSSVNRGGRDEQVDDGATEGRERTSRKVKSFISNQKN